MRSQRSAARPTCASHPDSMIPALCEAVKAKAVGAADRIGILSDQAALTKAGLLDPALYMLRCRCWPAYAAEDDATVWGMVLEQLAGLHALLVGGGAPNCSGSSIRSRARCCCLGWRSSAGRPSTRTADLTRKLRGELICVLPNFCATDAAVVGEARRRFDAFVAAPEGALERAELPAEYQDGAVQARPQEWRREGVRRPRFSACSTPRRRMNDGAQGGAAGASARRTDAAHARALEFAIGGGVKLQDLFYVAISVDAAHK